MIQKKKKKLNFKENKMTPPLCTFFRTTHCCLSIVSEANTYVSASGIASIPLHRRQRVSDSFFNHTLIYIQNSSRERLLHFFLSLLVSFLFFNFIILIKFCFKVCMGPLCKSWQYRKKFRPQIKRLNSLR